MAQLEINAGRHQSVLPPPVLLSAMPLAAPSAQEFLGDVEALNRRLKPKDALGVLRLARQKLLAGGLAIVSSFGADSGVLLYLVAQIDPDLPVLFLDTGQHFMQTLSYVRILKAHFGLRNVRILSPGKEDLLRYDPAGDLWKSDPDSCCHIRKTEPLHVALGAYGGWVTGRKRHQTAERREIGHFERIEGTKLKVNPLAFWSKEDIEAHKARHPFPEHPLLAKGYASIGCAPCTSRVGAGEDARAGRWRGAGKIECGIHVNLKRKVVAMGASDKTLFKDGDFAIDPWRKWSPDILPTKAGYVHVPFEVFCADRAAFLACSHPLGLLLSGGDDVAAIGADLSRFSSIAIDFAAFTDGRGYSSARLVVERFGYGGELRAVGDVLTDQIAFMRRCGFNAFVVSNSATRKALEQGGAYTVSVFMQPVGKNEVPLGRRPFLRAAPQAHQPVQRL